MTRERRTDEPRRWASQLRGIALVAALAIVWSALLPLVHGAATLSGDCGVCSLFAHDAGGAADLVAMPDVEPVVLGPESVVSEHEAVLPRADFDRRWAVLIESPLFLFICFHDLEDIAHARTEVFFLLVVVELVIALNCRSLVHSVFKAPPHKWLVVALAWEVVLIAVLIQIPAVRESFGINVPSFADLGLIMALGLVVFVIIEATKAFLRRRTGTSVGAPAER